MLSRASEATADALLGSTLRSVVCRCGEAASERGWRMHCIALQAEGKAQHAEVFSEADDEEEHDEAELESTIAYSS